MVMMHIPLHGDGDARHRIPRGDDGVHGRTLHHDDGGAHGHTLHHGGGVHSRTLHHDGDAYGRIRIPPRGDGDDAPLPYRGSPLAPPSSPPLNPRRPLWLPEYLFHPVLPKAL